MGATTQRDQLLELARERPVFTAKEAAEAGIHSQVLTRLLEEGVIERISRGTYRLEGRPVTEHHGLALVAAAVPHGVVCLLSALSFHEIGTQLPSKVWIAVERGTRRPTLAYPPLEVVHFSGEAFATGVETHTIEGQEAQVYGIAKTLADLFKYRNRIGLEVGMEALREAWRDRRFKMEDLDEAARACRVERVMRPYIQGILA